MIKVIIFDLGNVIVKVDKTEQFKSFSVNSDNTVSCIKEYFENSYWRKAFEMGELKPKEFFEKTAKELNLKMDFDNFKKVWCNIFTLNKDIENLIKDLKKRFRLILLSNTDEVHFAYIREKFKIVNAFDEQVLSYKVGHRKPNPLIFLQALKKANTLPFNCVYFDDIPEFVYVIKYFQFYHH